jgi:MinD superfamily P-loop ATPase
VELILPIIDQKKCNLCGDCVEQCPTNALAMVDKRIIFVQPTECSYCGDCEAICARGAIRVEYEIRW